MSGEPLLYMRVSSLQPRLNSNSRCDIIAQSEREWWRQGWSQRLPRMGSLVQQSVLSFSATQRTIAEQLWCLRAADLANVLVSGR